MGDDPRASVCSDSNDFRSGPTLSQKAPSIFVQHSSGEKLSDNGENVPILVKTCHFYEQIPATNCKEDGGKQEQESEPINITIAIRNSKKDISEKRKEFFANSTIL